MRRVAIILCVGLFAALPAISYAQYNDTDQQNPKEYHDEDSQLLALFADVLYPIGYALEWTVARPLHYIASDSPAAPVFQRVGGGDGAPAPPAPIIPDNTVEESGSTSAHQDWSPVRSPITTNTTVIKQQVAPSSPPPSGSQPVLH